MLHRWLRLVSVLLLGGTTLAGGTARANFPFVKMGLGNGFLHHSFADALANSFSASGITVYPGTYHECVNVTGFVLFTIAAKKGVVLDATGCEAGITISDGEGITVKGLTIVGAKRGIAVRPLAKRVLVTKTTIRDPAVDPQLAVMETGVQIQVASDVTLDGVTIRGAKNQAVQVIGTMGTTVRKSTLADGVGDGVSVDLGSTVIIGKNVMTNLGGLGVLFFHGGGGGPSDSSVTSNKIFSTSGGIEIAGANNVIEKNKLTDVGAAAIRATADSGGSTYRKNTIVGGLEAGIAANGNGDTFEKNTVKEPLADGVRVTGDGNVFLGNKVTAAVGNGFRIDATASGNRFEGSSSSKAGADGFHVDGTANVFVKAKAAKSVGLDRNDAAGAATTNVYTDCKFKTSSLP